MQLREGLDKDNEVYLLSHLGIIKFFAAWGILESILFLITKGDKYKEIVIHMGIFIIISLIAYLYPSIKNELI
jgi:uncharacterized membrane protein YkgB